MWTTFFVVSIFGIRAVGNAVTQRRIDTAEKRRVRLAMTPFLQAEQDLIEIETLKEMALDEAFIMRERPDWQPKTDMGTVRHMDLPKRPQQY